MTTNVYIDGFNFYYGSVKDGPYRWMDFVALSERLLRGHHIQRVKYFTARVSNRAGDPNQSVRQDTYLRALNTRPEVELHFGQFRTQPKMLPTAKKPHKFVRVLATEEKGSDVALGAHLVWDACHEEMTHALVMSNDSDLQTPVDMAVKLGVEVIVLNPHRHSGQGDSLRGSDRRNLRRAHLDQSQLPDPCVDEFGHVIHMPTDWA